MAASRRRQEALDNDEIRKKPEARYANQAPVACCLRISDLIRHSSFVIRILIRHSSFVIRI